MLAITEKNAMWKFEQWKQLLDGGDEMLQRMYTEGEAILRAHNQNVESVVKGGARKCSIHKDGPLDDGDIYTLWQKDGLAANCPPHLHPYPDSPQQNQQRCR